MGGYLIHRLDTHYIMVIMVWSLALQAMCGSYRLV